jgi:hypothetical protein
MKTLIRGSCALVLAFTSVGVLADSTVAPALSSWTGSIPGGRGAPTSASSPAYSRAGVDLIASWSGSIPAVGATTPTATGNGMTPRVEILASWTGSIPATERQPQLEVETGSASPEPRK